MQAIKAAPFAAETVESNHGPVTSAFANKLADLRPDLYRLALSLTKDPSSAEDLVQETLVKAMGAGTKFRNGTDLRAWSRTILKNTFLDARRKRGAFHQLGHDPAWSPPDATIGPLDVLTLEDVRAVLGKLDPQTQEIFRMACFEQVGYREIGLLFQMPPPTVGTRLLRARAKLKRRLQEVFEKRLAAMASAEMGQLAALLPLRSGAGGQVVRLRVRAQGRARARQGGGQGSGGDARAAALPTGTRRPGCWGGRREQAGL